MRHTSSASPRATHFFNWALITFSSLFSSQSGLSTASRHCRLALPIFGSRVPLERSRCRTRSRLNTACRPARAPGVLSASLCFESTSGSSSVCSSRRSCSSKSHWAGLFCSLRQSAQTNAKRIKSSTKAFLLNQSPTKRSQSLCALQVTLTNATESKSVHY